MEKLLFYGLASVAIIAAFGVIVSNRLIFKALWLVLTFIATLGIWLLLKAEFLALLLGLIYLGTIIIFFVLIIMLFNLTKQLNKQRFNSFALLGIIGAIVLTIGMDYKILNNYTTINLVELLQTVKTDELVRLYQTLFTGYLLPISIISILLLTAIIVTISLLITRDKK